MTLSSEGLCILTTCEPGLYFGAQGCLECPSCESCESEGLCELCDCEVNDEGATEDGTQDSSSLTKIKQNEKQEAAVTQTASSLGSAIVVGGALMTGSPDAFASLFMTVELLSYLPLINMQLTQHQVDLLVGANQLKDLPDYISGLKCYAHHSRKNYDFDCSSFLKIAQKELAIISVLGVITLGVTIVACAAANCLDRSTELLKKVLPLARRLLLMVLTGSLIKAAYSAQLSGIDSVQEAFSWVMIVIVWLLFFLLGGVGCFAACSESYPLLQHLLFNDLKPTSLSRLNFSLLVLHRTVFALLIATLDASKVQLSALSIITAAVSPSQFTLYLLIVRPHQDIKDSILQLGTHCIITGVCSFLTLSEFEVFGNDKELVSTGCVWSIMSIVFLHGVAMLAKVASIVREILKSENEPQTIVELADSICIV
jgi:hypothetical protein